MDTFLPKGFEPGLRRNQAAIMGSTRALHVQARAIRFPVLRAWASGFAVDARKVPALTGLVDIFEGAVPLFQGVIASMEVADGVRVFHLRPARPLDFAVVSDVEEGVDIAIGPRSRPGF